MDYSDERYRPRYAGAHGKKSNFARNENAGLIRQPSILHLIHRSNRESDFTRQVAQTDGCECTGQCTVLHILFQGWGGGFSRLKVAKSDGEIWIKSQIQRG